MSEKKMAIYAKAMNRLQPSPLLNSQVIARVNEEAESASEIVIGSSDRILQPSVAQTRVAQTRVAQRISGKPRTTGWRVSNNMVTVAASLLMVLFLTAGGYYMVLTPTTWVDVDINPSVELGLNRLNRVIDTKGINEDGVAVLEQVSLLGNKPEKAVKSIVETAARLGYMKPDQENVVALTVIADKPEQEKTLAKKIRSGADAALEAEGMAAEIVEQSMKPERVQRAQDLQKDGVDISPGKLNLIEKLQDITSDAALAGVSVEKYEDSHWYELSVRDIQKQVNEYRKSTKDIGESGNSSAPGQQKKNNNNKFGKGDKNKPDKEKENELDEDDDTDALDADTDDVNDSDKNVQSRPAPKPDTTDNADEDADDVDNDIDEEDDEDDDNEATGKQTGPGQNGQNGNTATGGSGNGQN